MRGGVFTMLWSDHVILAQIAIYDLPKPHYHFAPQNAPKWVPWERVNNRFPGFLRTGHASFTKIECMSVPPLRSIRTYLYSGTPPIGIFWIGIWRLEMFVTNVTIPPLSRHASPKPKLEYCRLDQNCPYSYHWRGTTVDCTIMCSERHVQFAPQTSVRQ